jgi:hypothetical protein
MKKLYTDRIDTAALQAILDVDAIDLELTSNVADADVTVRLGDREPCDPETICAGGWIECPAAWAMAQKLGISVPNMGTLLAHLNVKVRNCGLGCF